MPAHEADVNVISWNRLAAFMLASGGDDGTLRVWDLRSFAAGQHVAKFAHHRCGGLLRSYRARKGPAFAASKCLCACLASSHMALHLQIKVRVTGRVFWSAI